MYEDFKDMVEDLQLVIPSTFEECFTYELQILYLKHLIDNIEPGGDYQEEIDNINRKLVTLQSEVAKLKNDVNNLNPDEVQRKLDAMQTEINGVKTSIQTITQNVTTLTGDVNNNTTDIETLTGEMTDVKNTLNKKQNVLTFDATPTEGSQNPVTSDGIKKAIDAGGGGGGGTGETQFTEYVITGHAAVDMTRKESIVYELSSSGIARRTDVEVNSISLGYGKNSVYLPKSGFYWALTPARVNLKGIGYADTVIDVQLYTNRIAVGGQGKFFTCDINNHMYLVNLKYSNNYVIS